MPTSPEVSDASPPLVLVTGAGGFIGRELCRVLLEQGFRVRGVTRREGMLPRGTETIDVGEIGPDTQWQQALADVNSVIHLAARVHIMHETAVDPAAEFHRINTVGTERLARQAAAAGVRRLVYVSSIKVNGEHTCARPFSAADTPAPQDPYAVSKWAAEQSLHHISVETGLETVIIRPPLVYGPGVGGNFLRLMRLIRTGLPLPLGAVKNRRSLVYLGNLADALAQCARHPAAAGKTFLISDGEDISTPELIRRLAREMGTSALLIPVPAALLRLGGAITGKRAELARLLDALQVDASPIRQDLGWVPPYSVNQGIAATAQSYIETLRREYQAD